MPFLIDDYILREISAFHSLLKLHVFKYQLKGPFTLASESLRVLDLDVEEFDENGDRVS